MRFIFFPAPGPENCLIIFCICSTYLSRRFTSSTRVPDPAALTLVAVDGSAGLTPRAPLTLLDRAQEADRWCRSVLAGRPVEDGGFLSEGGVLEPELWFELAALTPLRAELVEADTSHGVGRYVAAWEI